jgi:hypothetical protein
MWHRSGSQVGSVQMDGVVQCVTPEDELGRLIDCLTVGLYLTVFRSGHGNKARKSRVPEKPLRFWAYEASPFVKV